MGLRRLRGLVALTGVVLLASCSDEVPAPETPAPSVSAEPTPDLPTLTLGPEVALPDNVALLLETGCFQCDGLATGLIRVYRDSSGLVQRELLVSAGAHVYYPDARSEQLYFAGNIPIPRVTINTAKGVQPYDPSMTGIAVSSDGSEIIVSVCSYPLCRVGIDTASGNASLYRSTDGGDTWADYGSTAGGAVIGVLAPGRVLVYNHAGSGELRVFAAPDEQEIERPESADPIAQLPFVLADGTIAWPNRNGELRRPDATPILKVPGIVYCPCYISWVAQQAFGERLIAVGWTGNTQENAGYISVFRPDGSEQKTVTSPNSVHFAVWLSDTELAANIGILAEELVSETPRFFPGLLPALIDLESRSIKPITEYFLEDGAEMGRNYVRGVQRLSVR